MRMNNRAGQTAFDILNTYPEEKLSDLLHHYGELKEARKIASLIVRSRDVQPILSSGTLIELLQPFVRKGKENKFLAQFFQALRIEVNDEMNALREMLQQALEVLKPGGRLVIITYHSLEDRLVKHFMRSGNFEGESQQDFFGNRLSPFLFDKLQQELKDVKYESLAVSGQLIGNNRLSQIELLVREKGLDLESPQTPPYIIQK